MRHDNEELKIQTEHGSKQDLRRGSAPVTGLAQTTQSQTKFLQSKFFIANTNKLQPSVKQSSRAGATRDSLKSIVGKNALRSFDSAEFQITNVNDQGAGSSMEAREFYICSNEEWQNVAVRQREVERTLIAKQGLGSSQLKSVLVKMNQNTAARDNDPEFKARTIQSHIVELP